TLIADFAAIDLRAEFAAQVGEPAYAIFDLKQGVLPGNTRIGRQIQTRCFRPIGPSDHELVGVEVANAFGALVVYCDAHSHGLGKSASDWLTHPTAGFRLHLTGSPGRAGLTFLSFTYGQHPRKRIPLRAPCA